LLQLFSEHHGLGHVFGTEVLVRLPKQRRRRLPDVMFVAASRSKILQKTVIDGAPDLIMEVVSTDSFTRDWREKYQEYERGGVREYWIVDRASKRVEAYVLGRNGKYKAITEENGKVNSTAMKGFYLRPEWMLQQHPPALAAALREMRVPL
jgi:Uma2 family endonuclease